MIYAILYSASPTYNISIIKRREEMGLLYSLMAYIYPESAMKLNEARIRTRAQRLVLCIKNAQYKLKEESQRAEIELVKQIKQDYHIRSREGERARMINIIKNGEKLKAYDAVIYSLNTIQLSAHTLEVNPSAISNECVIAISTLLYAYEELELNAFINLNEFIPPPHPKIDIRKINEELQKYLSKKQVTDYEMNLYVCEMKERTGVSLEEINHGGHEFVSNPMEPNYETPSSYMFAVSLEEGAVLEEEENQY